MAPCSSDKVQKKNQLFVYLLFLIGVCITNRKKKKSPAKYIVIFIYYHHKLFCRQNLIGISNKYSIDILDIFSYFGFFSQQFRKFTIKNVMYFSFILHQYFRVYLLVFFFLLNNVHLIYFILLFQTTGIILLTFKKIPNLFVR